MSDAINSSTRRLKLVTYIQSRRYATVNDIAEEFGISRRTVFRDMIVLSEMGIPISSDRDRGYSLDSSYSMPAMVFDHKQLSTLMVGLGYLKGQVDKGLSQSARDVELRILSRLNEDQKSYVRAIDQNIILYPYSHEHTPEVSIENWYDILNAIHKRHTITCRYHSLREDRISQRVIDPYLLVYYTDHWDLIGKCHQSNSLRTFVLSRISELSVDTKSYFTRDSLSTKQILHRDSPDNRMIRIRVAHSELDRLVLGLPALIQTRTDSVDYSDLVFEFDNIRWMNQWLLQFGSAVTILDPPEMKSDREALLKELLK